MQQVKQLVTKNEQEWRSGESTCVPSLRGGGEVLPIVAFMLQVYERLGLLLLLCLTERFFSWCSGFPLSQKTNLSKF